MKLIGALIASCALTGLLAAQPSLWITSPADGIAVRPGETLIVTVEVSPPEAFGLVFVAGFDPIGFSEEELNKPPYRFTLQIPRGIRPDRYSITAAGFTSPNRELLSSHPITILVERVDSPVSLTVYPVIADFTMDQKRYFSVTGHYADKTEVDLSQSSRIKYVSSNPQIATVQEQGIVSPVQPGRATISITYDGLTVVVPVRVRGSER